MSTSARMRDTVGSITGVDHHWIAYLLGFVATAIALANGAVSIRMYTKLSSDLNKQTEFKNDMVFSATSVAVASIVLVLLGVGVAKKW